VTGEVQVLPGEVTDRKLRLYRMDFVATLRSDDGRVRTVLIELQRVMAPDFVGRFRSYIGRTYLTPRAIVEPQSAEHRKIGEGHLPLVAVYFFGFVLEANFPKVFRIRRRYLHYRTKEPLQNEVEAMEKLTHDAVVVQIPKVGEAGDTPLDRILSLFDQSKMGATPYVLEYSEEKDNPMQDTLVTSVARKLEQVAANMDAQDRMRIEYELQLWARELEYAFRAKREAEREAEVAVAAAKAAAKAAAEAAAAAAAEAAAAAAAAQREKDAAVAASTRDLEFAAKRISEAEARAARLEKMLRERGVQLDEPNA
jgi:hypothetical protein